MPSFLDNLVEDKCTATWRLGTGHPSLSEKLPKIPEFVRREEGETPAGARSRSRRESNGTLEGSGAKSGGASKTLHTPPRGGTKEGGGNQIEKREPPSEVTSGYLKVKKQEVLLRNATRRLKRKLRLEPGDMGPPLGRMPEFTPSSKGRCRKCGPCLRKTCGECRECKQKKMCLKDRWCETWPRETSVPELSHCSNVSSYSLDGWKRAEGEVDQLCRDLKEVYADLGVTLEANGNREWPGLPELDPERLLASHDRWLDEAETVLGEARQKVELAERIEEVSSEPGSPRENPIIYMGLTRDQRVESRDQREQIPGTPREVPGRRHTLSEMSPRVRDPPPDRIARQIETLEADLKLYQDLGRDAGGRRAIS